MSDEVIGVKAVLDLSSWSNNVSKVIDDSKAIEGGMDGIVTSAHTFEQGLQTLESSIVAVGAAYAVFDRIISGGESIIQTTAVFERFVGGLDAARIAEAQLSRTTHGLVDDQVAMDATTKLLSLHLVDNADQAAQIIGLGAELGQVFLHDAAGGINAFNVALANESPRALQSLGISADAVTARMKELEKSGMSARDAFRQALVNIATDVRDGIGESAIMAGTAWQQLKIQAQDTIDHILEWAAGGVESLGTLSNALGVLRNYQPPSAGTAAGIVSNTVGAAPEVMQNTQIEFLNLVEQGAERARTELGRLNVTAQEAYTGFQEIYAQGGLGYGIVWTEQDMITAQRYLDTTRQIASGERDIGQTLEQLNQLQEYNVRLAQQRADAANAQHQATIAEIQLANLDSGTQRLYLMLQDQANVQGLQGVTPADIYGQEFFTSEQAQIAEGVAADVQITYERLKAFKEQGGPITDADLAKAKEEADQAQRFAGYVQDGADRLANMNLSQLMGQGTGGPAGELEGMVNQWLQGQNLAASALQRISDSMGLVTGQQTDVSLYMQNVVVPQLGQIAETDATLAGKIEVAIQNYLDQMKLTGQQATAAGIAQAEATAMYGPYGGVANTPASGSGGTFTITAGQSATEIANVNNLTIPQVLSITGALNVNSIPQGTFNLPSVSSVPMPAFVPTTNNPMIMGSGTPTTGGAPADPAQQATDLATTASLELPIVRDEWNKTGDVVRNRAMNMGDDMKALKETGKTELTGPEGLTNWWQQLQQKIQAVYDVIYPLITNLQQGMTAINGAAQNLNGTPPTGAPPTTPPTGGSAIGGAAAYPLRVGERGPELFTPERAGYIVNAANTESILSALAGVINSGGMNHVENNQRSATIYQVNHINSNAQAAATMQGVANALRGF